MMFRGSTATSRARSRGSSRFFWATVAGIALLALSILCSLCIGSRTIPLADVLDALWAFDARRDTDLIVQQLRIPRTIVALLAGLALGVAGTLMQAMTRNPLAEPGLLGINAGAALAVVIGVVAFDLTTMLQYVWLAFAGAAIAGVAVFYLGQVHESGTNPVRLVLAGAGISVMLGALTGVVTLNAPPAVFDSFRNWAAGSVEGRGRDVIAVLSISTGIGFVMALSIAGRLNSIALGEDLGTSLGVGVRATWLLACISVALLAGAATAGAGPITFVGLAAPHVARGVTGPDYRWLLPYSGLFSAILLLGSDIVGRVVASPSEVSVGIVASLVGGAFFVVVARNFRLIKP